MTDSSSMPIWRCIHPMQIHDQHKRQQTFESEGIWVCPIHAKIWPCVLTCIMVTGCKNASHVHALHTFVPKTCSRPALRACAVTQLVHTNLCGHGFAVESLIGIWLLCFGSHARHVHLHARQFAACLAQAVAPLGIRCLLLPLLKLM